MPSSKNTQIVREMIAERKLIAININNQIRITNATYLRFYKRNRIDCIRFQ